MSDSDFFVQMLRISLKALVVIVPVCVVAVMLIWIFHKSR